MDYYGFFRIYLIIALIQTSISFTLAIVILYNSLTESKVQKRMKSPKIYVKEKIKYWNRVSGRLERVLSDSDKIANLYNKWLKQSQQNYQIKNLTNMKKSNIWHRKNGRLIRY
tara:strand:+ start:438 stop:776 length:339 start_codon:yes stop_codon:yes gene_type:complete